MLIVRSHTSRSVGRLDHLYKGLISDYNHRNEFGYIYSDGYDVVSNAMLFLWQHNCKRLGDIIEFEGKETTTLYRTDMCEEIIEKLSDNSNVTRLDARTLFKTIEKLTNYNDLGF